MSGQPISLDSDPNQTAQVLDPQRKFAGQMVILQVQIPEAGQVSEFGWYWPSEIVAREEQFGEVEVTEFGRYRPSETVASDDQVSEAGQVSEFWRQAAVQRLISDHPREVDPLDA